MKILIALSALFFASTSSAQDVEQIKKQVMQICSAQVEQLEESEREAAIIVCQCTADNTDYEALLADMSAGNMAKIQTDGAAVAEKCAADDTSG